MLKIKISDTQAPTQALNARAKKRQLLIVDDEVGILSLLQSLFSPLYTVRTAASGLDALAILHQGFAPQVSLFTKIIW